jgi:hypothetical protein
MTSALPRGFDTVLFCHFLVIWTPEQNIELLRKAYVGLSSGGRVVIFNSMANDDEDGPLFAALDCAYFMAIPTKGGLIYSAADYESWLRVAGFENIERKKCDSWTPHGIVIATKE